MAAAFGLYTHIRANRVRSVFLLVGLFFLVYLMVFAGALFAEGFLADGAPLEVLIRRAQRDFLLAFPWATAGAACPIKTSPSSAATTALAFILFLRGAVAGRLCNSVIV